MTAKSINATAQAYLRKLEQPAEKLSASFLNKVRLFLKKHRRKAKSRERA